MRLERYLEERAENVANFADALDSFISANKTYEKALDAEDEKSNEKSQKASMDAYDARQRVTEDLVKFIEKITGVQRFVVESE
jgi:hypothetical protein